VTGCELPPIFVSVNDAKRMLALGHTRIYELMKSGDLVKVKSGNKTLITYESVLSYSEKIKRATSDQTN
jgi:hypothetical protein